MHRDDLIQLIYENFDGVAPPVEITLHVAEAHDNHDYEHDEVHRAKDNVGSWQALPEAHILQCPNALAHLDKYGIHYYLPAYIIWYLKNPNSQSWARESALYTFDDHAKDAELSLYFKNRFSLFTQMQMQACSKFVAFCIEDKEDEHDFDFAAEIYQRYWSKRG